MEMEGKTMKRLIVIIAMVGLFGCASVQTKPVEPVPVAEKNATQDATGILTDILGVLGFILIH